MRDGVIEGEVVHRPFEPPAHSKAKPNATAAGS